MGEEIVERAVENVDADNGARTVERTPRGQFLKGHRKVGGRARGQSKFSWITRDICAQKGIHPLELALDVILTGYLPPVEGENKKERKPVSAEERLKMLREVLGYALPKLSGVQLTGANGGPVAVATVDVTKLMEDPELAIAAERLAIAIATGGNPPRTESFDDKSGAAIDIRRRPD